MIFWFMAALLTCAVIIAITWPLQRDTHEAEATADADLRVYKDQLAEIDVDLARGVMSAAEADAARIEVSRRILAADRQGRLSEVVRAPIAPKTVAIACAMFIPLAGLALYSQFGAPGLPDQPRYARREAPPDQMPVAELIAKVEERLRLAPEDGQGWAVIAPIYLRQGRLKEARAAYEKALTLQGRTVPLLSGFAQADIGLAGGDVTDAALSAYREMATIAPDRPDAKYWIAVGLEQRDKFAEARDLYAGLVASAPADAPWLETVKQRLTSVERRVSGALLPPSGTPGPTVSSTPSATSSSGPSPDQVEAAGSMAPADRLAMIRGMVDGLAERLKADGSDPAGWQRLLRSYVVLGELAKARAALGEARAALASKPDAVAEVDAAAQALGIAN